MLWSLAFSTDRNEDFARGSRVWSAGAKAIARSTAGLAFLCRKHRPSATLSSALAAQLSRVGYDRSAMDKFGSRCCGLRTAILIEIPLLLLLSIAISAQTPSPAATRQREDRGTSYMAGRTIGRGSLRLMPPFSG